MEDSMSVSNITTPPSSYGPSRRYSMEDSMSVSSITTPPPSHELSRRNSMGYSTSVSFFTTPPASFELSRRNTGDSMSVSDDTISSSSFELSRTNTRDSMPISGDTIPSSSYIQCTPGEAVEVAEAEILESKESRRNKIKEMMRMFGWIRKATGKDSEQISKQPIPTQMEREEYMQEYLDNTTDFKWSEG